MAAFDYAQPTASPTGTPFGMSKTSSPSMLGEQSSFDSSGMKYDSGQESLTGGEGTSTPKPATQPSGPVQPTQTDGTLLGTVAPKSTYQLQGFSTDKFNDPNKSDAKYTPAARAWFNYLSGGGQAGRNNLQGAVDYAKANGFPNAHVVGDDKVDYGDGNGPIDSVMSNGSLWFQNGADRFGPAQAPSSLLGTSTTTPTSAAPSNPTGTQNQFGNIAQMISSLFGGMTGGHDPSGNWFNSGGPIRTTGQGIDERGPTGNSTPQTDVSVLRQPNSSSSLGSMGEPGGFSGGMSNGFLDPSRYGGTARPGFNY